MLSEININCQQLGKVVISDHFAIQTHKQLNAAREQLLMKDADWQSMRRALDHTDWEPLLVSHKHEPKD